MAHPRLLLVVPILVAGLLAGCGADSKEASAPETTEVAGADSTASATTVDEGSADTTETTEGTDTTEDAGTETTTATGGLDAGCESLQAIADFDVQSGKLISGGADWSEIQAYFVESTDDVVADYDDAIEANPAIADDLTTLRDYTSGLDELAAAATSLADLGNKLTSLPGTDEAGRAGLAVNSYTEDNCGFSTGDN